jgi:hypothetical protein
MASASFSESTSRQVAPPSVETDTAVWPPTKIRCGSDGSAPVVLPGEPGSERGREGPADSAPSRMVNVASSSVSVMRVLLLWGAPATPCR